VTLLVRIRERILNVKWGCMIPPLDCLSCHLSPCLEAMHRVRDYNTRKQVRNGAEVRLLSL